ncbi:hypothetical protein [Paremcibacter congregatus]|uniref:Uncharacterized protein n=1 Tax=Paremcibacter congregatus TaxID=2043170 RepID=A0A2G4YNT9_9PROT|nr:hypothetical protein [Paremcibacter congregatus]PHZ83967.1 hypothetical protein CRD36_14240 [Paremcibacter congregatus]QDE25940.1 hypothetical protein FIV45_00915 [Paremcibacter congregatus]
MISDSIRAGAATILGQISSQPAHRDKTSDSIPGHDGGRIIRDQITLSAAGAQSLEEHRQAEKDAQNKLVDEIMTKGIREWAQEKYREKIEAEVRAQVLSSMGLTEDDYASLEAEVQKRISDIIEQKVKERLEEEMSEQAARSAAETGQDPTFQQAFLSL